MFNAFGGQTNSIRHSAEKTGSTIGIVAMGSGPIPKRYNLLIPSCLCIISRYPFFKTFNKILMAIYSSYNEFLEYPLEYYISAITTTVPVPPRGFYRVVLNLGLNCPDIIIENSLMNQLPLLDINFAILPRHFSLENAIKLVNTIILEHNVLFVSSQTEKLTQIAESIMALMFPFDYQLVYIPVLPETMVEFLNSPVPFVSGIHTRLYEQAIEGVGKDTCIANIDTGIIEFKDEVDGKYVGKPESDEIAELPKHETTKLIGRVTEEWYFYFPINS